MTIINHNSQDPINLSPRSLARVLAIKAKHHQSHLRSISSRSTTRSGARNGIPTSTSSHDLLGRLYDEAAAAAAAPRALFFLATLFSLVLLPLLLRRFIASTESPRDDELLSRLPSPPNKLPVIGHLHLMGTHPHISLAALAASRAGEQSRGPPRAEPGSRARGRGAGKEPPRSARSSVPLRRGLAGAPPPRHARGRASASPWGRDSCFGVHGGQGGAAIGNGRGKDDWGPRSAGLPSSSYRAGCRGLASPCYFSAWLSARRCGDFYSKSELETGSAWDTDPQCGEPYPPLRTCSSRPRITD